MMVVPFTPDHLKDIRSRDEVLDAYLGDHHIAAIPTDHAYTGLVDGRPIGCCGVVEQHENRAEAWAYLDGNAGRHMAAVTRAVGRFLDVCPFDRVQAAVAADFARGNRWALLLGFELEGRMRRYGPDGRDFNLYARVRA